MSSTLKMILEGGHGVERKYVPDFVELEKYVRILRESDYKIVLTQGVYDMFHVGHKRYLEAASKFGDILIVGVDSDELTRQTKGQTDPTRPFDSFEARSELLCALSFIKIVTRRDVDRHTDDLIRLVKPDVLVISQTTSSFNSEKIKELEQYCGKIEHLVAQADPSVTSTTAKLRRLRAEGAKELALVVSEAVKTSVEKYLNGGSDER